MWKTFKVEFKDLEEEINAAKDEVSEELKLASEQEAHSFRQLLTSEVKENQAFRSQQLTEISDNRQFRSDQILARDQRNARQIWKIQKEEGICYIQTMQYLR